MREGEENEMKWKEEEEEGFFCQGYFCLFLGGGGAFIKLGSALIYGGLYHC